MTDIFADWKQKRFVTVSYDLLDNADEQMIILSDYMYWGTCETELDAWCDAHGAVRQGMTVTFPDQKTLTLFALRWS